MLQSNSFEESSMGKLAMVKAQEFFHLCDQEEKGFIIKRDIQRLQTEIGLTPDQLEEVFESLDSDKNGFLTMEEFIKGFGAFLGLQVDADDIPSEDERHHQVSLADELAFASHSSRMEPDSTAEEEHFQSLMDTLGAAENIPGKDMVKDIWSKLRKDDPELLSNFEHFLGNVSGQLKQRNEELSHLESAILQRGSSHDQEVQKLHEEMENQIRLEKERIAEEERAKANKLKDKMEKELIERDRQLQETLAKQAALEEKMRQIIEVRELTEQEKQRLQEEREEVAAKKELMESQLEGTQKSLKEAKEQLESIKKQTREEKRERAKSAFKVTETIATEREGLVKELDSLRMVNKKLKDEKDEKEMLRRLAESASKKGATPMESYSGQSHPLQCIPDDLESEYEVDDNFIPGSVEIPMVNPYGFNRNSLLSELEGVANDDSFSPAFPRRDPLGAVGAQDDNVKKSDTILDSATPERLFKLVFVGDSGVGKTCFLHRFCHDRFIPTFSATIGVDFQVRSLVVDKRMIALQLWDTAGQERFRSITKQYFRKADGVVLMYDVTSELSFINLRNWMLSVREGVEENCVICLVGNKVDLIPDENCRVLKYKDGQRLADEYGALFYETSAQTGESIMECMCAVAMLLSEREDRQLENALKLEMTVDKKTKCCGKR